MFVVALMLCGSVCVAQSNNSGVKFSRPTVKGHRLKAAPKWHIKLYEDEHYRFVFRHYGNAEFVPGFFAYDLKRKRWLEITELTTELARLGRSPDPNEVPLMVGWNFSDLSKSEYTQLPLKTFGSIIFPDRITFDPTTKLYRFDCNSALNREESLTSFWVRQADLNTLSK
jgi:hypothetical protein